MEANSVRKLYATLPTVVKWAALTLVSLVVVIWYCVSPDNVVLFEARSPDGQWTASLEETVFKVSVATPIKRIEVWQGDPHQFPSKKINVLQFNQDDESEPVGLIWRHARLLEVHLPRSANSFVNQKKSVDTIEILYSSD